MKAVLTLEMQPLDLLDFLLHFCLGLQTNVFYIIVYHLEK